MRDNAVIEMDGIRQQRTVHGGLISTYYHECQHLATRDALSQKKEGSSGGMRSWMQKHMGDDFHRLGFDKNVEQGMLTPMFGGNSDERPETYVLLSPVTHVKKDWPSTLFIHGEHDILAPGQAIIHLHLRLKEEDVPVVMYFIPQTDHAFDLILPKISRSTHNAYYDIEHFLALLA